MTETTITLPMPIRRVVLADPAAAMPLWLREQHRRLLGRTSDRAAGPANSAAEPSGDSAALRDQIAALEQAATQLRDAAKLLHTRWEQVLLPELQHLTIELAHAIAAKLVLDQVASDQFPIENLVQQALERLNTDRAVVVKLHPADFAVWQQHVESQMPACVMRDNVRVQPDASLSRGDCHASAGEVSIVYELRRQIEELRQQMVS